MLDYDMLASPNYARLIYDGDGNEHGFAGPNRSGQVEQVFKSLVALYGGTAGSATSSSARRI